MNKAKLKQLEREYAQRMRPKAELIYHFRQPDGTYNPPLPDGEDEDIHILEGTGVLPRAAYGPVDCW